MKKALILMLMVLSIWAVPYKVGQSVAPLDFQDQFGKRTVFKEMPKTVIMAFEKGTSGTVNDFLNAQDVGYLKKFNAVYVADISGMPNFITEVFALPKMRKFTYPVLLIRDEEQGLKFPGEEKKITIMKFQGNTLTDISYVSTPAQIKAAIEQ
ncbi:MAG: hypothetical protein WC680_09580 [Sulfuricurvum sp.]|jgi:hypothetical protein